MSCLNDARLQAAAEGEATPAERDHLRACGACSARLADAHAAVAEFAHQMSELAVPPMLGARVAAAVGRASADRRGATTLRDSGRAVPRRTWLFAGAALAATIVAIVFVLLPSVDPRTTLSAAEILDRSLQTLTRQGVESLEYELSIVAPSALPDETGTYRIEQLIDHDSGRWRFARYAPDGTVLNGISENPATGIREALMRVDGRTVRFHFTIPPDQRVRLWDLQRRYAESLIRLMQASAGQVVTEQGTGDQKQYVVELPATPEVATSAIFDLNHARMVVDGTDFHVVEFSAAGAAMGEPLSIGYRLIQRVVAASGVQASEFDLPRDPNAIELSGEGTSHVPSDVFMLLLRSLKK